MQPRILTIGVLLALAACGGGGGDPGTCHGSPEVCAQGQSTTSAPATTAGSTSAVTPAPAPPASVNAY